MCLNLKVNHILEIVRKTLNITLRRMLKLGFNCVILQIDYRVYCITRSNRCVALNVSPVERESRLCVSKMIDTVVSEIAFESRFEP